jgi:cell division protein FtsA
MRAGCCLASLIGKGEAVEAPSVGGRSPRRVSRQILAEILEPRMEELLNLIQVEIEQSKHGDQIASGVVLTGGSSLLEGTVDMAEQVFNAPARLGYPKGVGGLTDIVKNPMFATAVGLILYGARHHPEKKFRIRDVNIFNRITNRMRRWFKDIV